MTRTIAAVRDRVVQEIVRYEVARYLSGAAPARRCAQCGRLFKPRQRWHFCCSRECRRTFYRGQFRPRD